MRTPTLLIALALAGCGHPTAPAPKAGGPANVVAVPVRLPAFVADGSSLPTWADRAGRALVDGGYVAAAPVAVDLVGLGRDGAMGAAGRATFTYSTVPLKGGGWFRGPAVRLVTVPVLAKGAPIPFEPSPTDMDVPAPLATDRLTSPALLIDQAIARGLATPDADVTFEVGYRTIKGPTPTTEAVVTRRNPAGVASVRLTL